MVEGLQERYKWEKMRKVQNELVIFHYSTIYSGIMDERSCQNSAKGSFFHNNFCMRPASLKQAEETKMTLQTQGQGVCFKKAYLTETCRRDQNDSSNSRSLF